MNLTDQEIITRLIQKDQAVTRWFFYEKCRPLLLSLMRSIFDHPVDYDEVVDSVYLLLMENDAQRLRSFGFRCSLCQWLKVVATRYLIHHCRAIERLEGEMPTHPKEITIDAISHDDARRDVLTLLNLMHNQRYRYVLEQLYLNEVSFEQLAKSMNIRVDNLYNIKKRAIAELTQIALKEDQL